MSKHKLVFDATDADTLAASDFVGSQLYAGSKLTSTLVGAKQALDVNVANTFMIDTDAVYNVTTNPTPDTEGLILNTRAAAPDATTQTKRVTGAQANSDAVVAANVHGQDSNSFGMLYNGTTWDRWQGTGGSANVNVSGGTVAVTQSTSPWVVSDAALANTAIENTAATVGTSAAALLAGQLASRKYWLGYNNSNKMIYVGKAAVTTANGMPQGPGVYLEYRLGPAVSVSAIGAGASLDYRVMELS